MLSQHKEERGASDPAPLILPDSRSAGSTSVGSLVNELPLLPSHLQYVTTYPIQSNRYVAFDQHCYTNDEIKLIKILADKIHILPGADNIENYFKLNSETSWYGWWMCQSPQYDATRFQTDLGSFTLPNRRAEDAQYYPLWSLANNMARQIGNWLGDRTKNQNMHVMNDPIMQVFLALMDWSYNDLVNTKCNEEAFQKLASYESFIKYVIHTGQGIGPDRFHLTELLHYLDEGTVTIASCLDRQQLPVLLSSIINNAKDLENIIGTYLHFLLNNYPASDNYFTRFTDGKTDCDASPVCQVFSQVNKQQRTDVSLSSQTNVNRFYSLIPLDNNEDQYKVSLREDLLGGVKFVDFATSQDKQNYFLAMTRYASLMDVIKTLEEFKTVQTNLGTYVFAINYRDQVTYLTENYIELIKSANQLIKNIYDASSHGFENILKSNVDFNKRYKHFQDNLRRLETGFIAEGTATKQLDFYSNEAINSMNQLQMMMNKLVMRYESGEAATEVGGAMQALFLHIDNLNRFLEAQLGRSPTLRKHPPLQLALPDVLEKTKKQEIEKSIDESEKISHKEAKLTLSSSFNIKFEESKLNQHYVGRWDDEVTFDSKTKKPHFTYRIYQGEKELGSVTFYNQPLLCVSSDGSRTNIIAASGIIDLHSIETKSITEICDALPQTLFDRVYVSAKSGAAYGALRGTTNLIAVSFKTLGFTNKYAKILPHLAYYGALFTFNFSQYYQQLEHEDDFTRMLSSTYAAAIDTGQLFILSVATGLLSDALNYASDYFSRSNWPRASQGLSALASLSRYSLFAYNAHQSGAVEAASSLIAGTATQTVIEKTGQHLIRKYLE